MPGAPRSVQDFQFVCVCDQGCHGMAEGYPEDCWAGCWSVGVYWGWYFAPFAGGALASTTEGFQDLSEGV